jgi:hypothetical protein
MSEGLEAIRAEVASAHGLDARALPFITGSSLEEIESSATALAKLVDTSRVRREEEPTDLLTAARAERVERKRELAALLTRPSPQPRDHTGRFAARGGFDGGARAPALARANPEAEHSATVARLISESRQSRGAADAGRHF